MTSTLSHISEKAWSDYSKSDYTPEQWHRSCLIHQHSGAPTSKNQCKLPVRTPNGAINRNGVHAAAAALAGARGGVDASDSEKATAKRALARLYSELDEDMPDSLAQSAVDDILAHVGVKGMKWGVRKDRGHEGERAKTRKIAKLDKKFEKNSDTTGTWMKLHNRAADLTNKNDIDRINNKPEYKNADFSQDSPLRRKYYAEHQSALVNNVRQAAEELGTNASGTRRIGIETDANGDWYFGAVDVKHDALDDFYDNLVGRKVEVFYTDDGHISRIEFEEDEDKLAQSSLAVDAFLEHYGVRGMKWGHIRTRAQIDEDSADVVAVKGAKEKIATNRTTNVLSNKELQNVVTRMNLESQYNRLITESKANGSPTQKMLDSGKQAVISFAIQKGQDKAADMVAAKNPAAGLILKTLMEKQREAAKQGEGKKKKK